MKPLAVQLRSSALEIMMNPLKQFFSLVALLLFFFVGEGTPLATNPTLHKVLALAGEFGSLAVRGNKITLYSPKTIRLRNGLDTEWQHPGPTHGAFTVEIGDGNWRKAQGHLPLSAAQGPALCDSLNQIDVSSTHVELANSLQKGARIKAVASFEDLLLVVYSLSAEPVRYDVHVALVRQMSGKTYQTIQSDLSTEYGNSCGIQSAGRGNYLVITDEPSGSSDFLGVYAYSVAQ